MWEIHNPVKTQTLPRTNTLRCAEKFGSVSVKTNYRSYRDFLQSFNENKTGSLDDQGSVSSVDSGVASFKLSESKSNNNSSSSLNSDLSSTSSHTRRSDMNGLKSSFGSYKEFLENYNNKKFSSVRPSLPMKKSVKSEIFIQVGDDNTENAKPQLRDAGQDQPDYARGKVSPELAIERDQVSPPKINGKSSPVNGTISPSNGESINVKVAIFNQKTPNKGQIIGNVSPVNSAQVHDTSSNNNSKSDRRTINDFSTNANETSRRTNGKTVETIKKFNNLSNNDAKGAPVTNGNLDKIKRKFSNGKTDDMPERSSFINGRTSPLSTSSIKKTQGVGYTTEIVSKIANGKLTENDNVNSNLNTNTKVTPTSPVGRKIIDNFQKKDEQNATPVQNGHEHSKLTAKKQIFDELNRINARFLNGELNKLNDKEVRMKKVSSNESLDSNQSNTTEEMQDENQSKPEDVTVNAERNQTFAAPPPPPPPPPMLNMNIESSTIPRKWDRVKTELETANATEPSKPKETNQAAMNLAKILTESRKLRKTKSVDDALELEGSSKETVVRKTPSPTYQNGIGRASSNSSDKSASKPSSLESLTDQPHSLPYLAPPGVAINATGRGGNNYMENKERTPSPPKQSDVQPPRPVYNAQTCARVTVGPGNPLHRTMSAPKTDNGASILEANAKTVVPVADRNAKIEKGDPNVKKLVYNTYRGLLGAYNNKANDIIATLPRNMVREDQGVTKQLESIALQGGLEKLNGRINPNPEKD